VTGGAISSSEIIGVCLVQGTARATLEAGVAVFALSERLTQRPAWGSTDVAGFAVGDLCGNQNGMEIVNRFAGAVGKVVTGKTFWSQQR
jgi:hypothetical protein